MRRTARVVAAGLVLLLTAACGTAADSAADPADDPADPATDPADPATDPADSADTAADALGGELTVFAAASLTDAFERLADEFEARHPDVGVRLNLASSSTLATQMIEGAPADVFAAANTAQMAVVHDAGLVEDPLLLARNVLAIAVEAGNPLGIGTLGDLARDDVVLVLAAPEVPAGDLAARVLDRAGVEVSPASLEVDVRATLARVELGEADAAIVYRSDLVTAADTVEAVPIAPEHNLATDYPIAVAVAAPNPDAAAAWVAFVTGPDGRAVLTSAGFDAS